MIMGYGDGLAALIGAKWGKRKLPLSFASKSYLGSLVMAVVSFIVTFIGLVAFTSVGLPTVVLVSLVVGLLCSAAEAVTPFGLDNTTVPFLALLVLEVLL
mgnify:FL=1